MITQGEDVEIHALKKQGWSIAAIARHVGRDRKTVRAYLNGDREVGVRAKPEEDLDPFDVVEPYVRQRLADDPHVRATVLFAEVQRAAISRLGQLLENCDGGSRSLEVTVEFVTYMQRHFSSVAFYRLRSTTCS